MIDLHGLRARAAESECVISAEEVREIVTELECARRLTDLPLDGTTGWAMTAQQDMVAQLLLNLAVGVAGPREAELVAGVVIQELAGLARIQVKSGGKA